MKYLCLVYRDEEEWDALPEREYDALVGELLAHREELRQSGHVVVADALHRGQTATTLRVRNGHLSIADGPFAETKEQLGGFYLIEAGDLNEAIRLAAKIPSARLGTVEVRPIKELEPR
jgi:hypothetical protein